jgi:hypothetical protein
VIWLNAACKPCGPDFKARAASHLRPQCPDCGSFDVATWRDDEDQMSLLGDGPPTVEVQAAERNALARVVAQLPACGERDLLQALLFRIERAHRGK